MKNSVLALSLLRIFVKMQQPMVAKFIPQVAKNSPPKGFFQGVGGFPPSDKAA
jgi:hypothetical protein